MDGMEGGGEYSQYLLNDDSLVQFPERQDDGMWMVPDLFDLGGADDMFDLFQLLNDDEPLTAKQLAADSSGVNHVQSDADPSAMEYLQEAMPAAGMFHGGEASLEQSPVGVEQPPPPARAPADATIQVGFDSLEPDADMLTLEIDNEKEIAEMVRVAAQCGEDDARMVWTEEEHKELLNRLEMYAKDDAVSRCFKIAFYLPKKTALDVALRCRWLQDKRRTGGKAELAQKDTTSGKLITVKGTKVAKISNKTYPLTKEALNSKSNKELIEDNKKFLKQIEENLKTGQLANTADYFYYVKTNMDAIQERGSKFGISMAMPPIDEQGLEEILKSRLNSLALTEDS